MCRLLAWRMVPIRRAQCIDKLSVEFTSEPSAGRGFCTRKAPASGWYLRQQCGWGGKTRLVRRALGSVHVNVHTHIYIYVCRQVYRDFALDVPASCVAHGAHQARSVHEHPLFRIHQ